jgi:hypothetical protein
MVLLVLFLLLVCPLDEPNPALHAARQVLIEPDQRSTSHVARFTCNPGTNPREPGEYCFISDLRVDASGYAKMKKLESANVVILGVPTSAVL